jgi:hypothetical protein
MSLFFRYGNDNFSIRVVYVVLLLVRLLSYTGLLAMTSEMDGGNPLVTTFLLLLFSFT